MKVKNNNGNFIPIPLALTIILNFSNCWKDSNDVTVSGKLIRQLTVLSWAPGRCATVAVRMLAPCPNFVQLADCAERFTGQITCGD